MWSDNEESMTDRPSRADKRLSFDNVPEIYDRARPAYPEALFDDLFAYAGRASSASELRILEIGPGTGQATAPLLDRGAAVTAIEIGPHLAAFLRAKFSAVSKLDVITGAFEDVDLEPAAYDLVFTATAFHWLDHGVRLTHAPELLRPGGALAIVSTNQIASDRDRGFFERTHPIYLRYRPNEVWEDLTGDQLMPAKHGELLESELFEDIALFRYRWDQTYSTSSYADLLRSYSDTQRMTPTAREALIDELCAVIDGEYGGSVTRPLVITLTLGRKPSA
jgi:SAM-dependent methyltransferase